MNDFDDDNEGAERALAGAIVCAAFTVALLLMWVVWESF